MDIVGRDETASDDDKGVKPLLVDIVQNKRVWTANSQGVQTKYFEDLCEMESVNISMPATEAPVLKKGPSTNEELRIVTIVDSLRAYELCIRSNLQIY